MGSKGWYREDERQSDTVSVCMLLGSLLAGVPLAIATLIDRSSGHWLPLNELGFLSVSILLLATGLMFQLKATTMTGAALPTVYFVSLTIFVPWRQMNTVALAITIGGAVVFGTGLLLSLYRDRLLALPDRIKQREGIFRVLNWR